MKSKILITAVVIGLFTVTTIKAQEKGSPNMKQDQTEKTVYTCTMHPEVTSEKPGECTKCNMILVKKRVNPKASSAKAKQTKATTTYVCSMHPKEVSSKSGKCPMCGMKMVKEKKVIKKVDIKKNNEHK